VRERTQYFLACLAGTVLAYFTEPESLMTMIVFTTAVGVFALKNDRRN
jgi:hypothetical protein